MKTKKEAARNFGEEMGDQHMAPHAFLAGIEWLESQASGKDFQDWWDLYKEAWDKKATWLVECAWQAARLSAQKEIAEKNAEIEKLKERIEELDYCQKAFYEATKKVGW